MADYALASLADIRAHMGIAPGFTEYDTALVQFSMVATSLLEDGLHVSFERKDYTEFLNTKTNTSRALSLEGASMFADQTNWTPLRFRLDGWPVDMAVTPSVAYDPYQVFGDGTVLTAIDNYTFLEDSGRLILNYPVRTASRSLRVMYSAGYQIDYDEYPDGDPVYVELEQSFDVSGSLSDQAALYDGNANKTAAESASATGTTGTAVLGFDAPQIVSRVQWFMPSDQVAQEGGDGVNLTLWGANVGDFSDKVQIAAKWYPDALQPGDMVTISAPVGFNTPYSFVRVDAGDGIASRTYHCSQIVWFLKNQARPFLRDVPAKLNLACCMLTKFLYQKSASGGVGMLSAVERKGTQFRTSAAVPDEVWQLVQNYRRLVMK